MGVSSDGTHVWVTNEEAFTDTVSEIEASSGTVIRTIHVGRGPFGVSSDGTHVWVTNEEADTVSEIKTSSGTVIRTIHVGSGPGGVSSDGTHVWVANYGHGRVRGDTVSEIPTR
jgi:YVTN family beta-propeller protein